MVRVRRRPLAKLVLFAALASAGFSGVARAAGAVACGSARPRLEDIGTAEGLVIAPDGTIYFSQPFVGSNTRYLGRYRPPYGAVYYSDQSGGHLSRVAPDGTKRLVTAAPITEPNGLAFGPHGRLYVVSWGTPEVTRLELANGVETRRERFATLPQAQADGIAFDAKGRIYVTAASTLHQIAPDGRKVTALGPVAGANVDFGAGALSCSDLYVAGNGQGIRLFPHDTPGFDVPWHRGAAAAGSVAAPRAAAAPQIAFPGQYAPAPAGWRFPVWPAGCGRFPGEEKACLEFVAFDYGRLSRYAAANAALPPARPDEGRVVFFGDSITDNWSKAGYGGFFPGRPYVNRGIGGQTTSQMLLRFRADVIEIRPKAVVILAGTNDVAGNSGPVALGVVQQNLATMAELASLHRVRVVLAALLPVSDDKKDGGGRPLVRTRDRPPGALRARNAWMAEYARENGHVYLDYFSALADADGALKPELNDDGLHPNAAGYAVMAPFAEEAIARALTGRR